MYPSRKLNGRSVLVGRNIASRGRGLTSGNWHANKDSIAVWKCDNLMLSLSILALILDVEIMMLGLVAAAVVVTILHPPASPDAGKIRWVMELTGLSEFTCPVFHEVLADGFIGTDGVQRFRRVDRSLDAATALNVWWVSVLARGAIFTPSCPQEITTVLYY